MPTIAQIRAARALLDWSQADLAEQAGLSQTGIARIENGTNKPNSQTLEKIGTAFENAEIEFIASTGVKKRAGEIRLLKGHDGFVNFLEDVYTVVKKNAQGGKVDVVVNNVAEDKFLFWEGDFAVIHEKRMQELDVQYKIIVKEGDRNFTASKYAEYRWADRETFSHISYYIYGDRTALIDFNSEEVVVYIIHSKAIADFYREEFKRVWTNSSAPK